MIKALLVTLAGRRGRIMSAGTGFAAAMISLAVTRYGLDLSGEAQALVAAFVMAVIGWFLDALAASLNSAGVTRIQEELQVLEPTLQTDGQAGPLTVQAARDVTTRALRRAPIPRRGGE